MELRPGKAASEAIRKAFPSARVRGGTCVIKIEGVQPGEVAEKARQVLEAVRRAAEAVLLT
jgi:hypothetical protein